MENYLTIPETAAELGVDAWRVRRLYEAGDLPEPPRLARARAIPFGDLGEIAEALRRRGWLTSPQHS